MNELAREILGLDDEELAQAGQMKRRYGRYVTRVDPRSVKLKRSYLWPQYLQAWPLAVCWGDWDLGGCGEGPFREDTVQQLLTEGVPYRETRRYREMVAELTEHGITGWRVCRSLEEIDRYIRGIFELYERIRTEGYRAREPGDRAAREITVCIERDGQMTKFGQGTHRLAIARLLALPSVPVVVDLMHGQWVGACREKRPGQSMRQAVEQELAELARLGCEAQARASDCALSAR